MPDVVTETSTPSTPAVDTPLSGETSTPSIEGTGDEFSGLGSDFDDTIELVESPQPEPATEVTVEESPAVQEPPATPEAAKPAPVQEPPKVQEAQPPAAPTAPQEPSVAEGRSTLQEQLTVHREALIEALASERFKLTPQEEEALETAPATAFPRLASKIYLETMTAVLNHLQNSVPLLIRHQAQVMDVESKAEKTFFEKFPTIDKTTHGQDIVTFANAFKQANPRISEADLHAMVGAAIVSKYGLQPVAPAPNGNGAVPPQPAPFRPAPPGASVKVTPIENPFAGLGMDFDD